MFVLLSSAATPRYREDILRCLAAPIGATIQFRYDKKWVAGSALEKLSQPNLTLKALVCYVEHEGMSVLRMIPVRAATVHAANLHGSTLSVILRIGEVLCADPEKFTNEVFTLSGQSSPQKQDGTIAGKYFFEVTNDPPSLKRSDTLQQWEETVSILRQQDSFQQEPFFWTVLGLQAEHSGLNTERFQNWPESVQAGTQFDLLLYHYQPSGDEPPNSKLVVHGGSSVRSISPADIAIDSRYDLKRWRFDPEPKSQKGEDTWIRIRSADRWDLDLKLHVEGQLVWMIVKAILAGLLIAVPSILSIIQQKDVSSEAKWATSILAAIAGIVAAFVVSFKIERYD